MVEVLFCARAQTTKGDPPPQQVQESLDEILQDLENQVHRYIRLVPTIRKFLQLKMDKFRAGDAKKFLPD